MGKKSVLNCIICFFVAFCLIGCTKSNEKIEEVFKKLIIMLKNCCNELEDMFFPKKLKENMNSKTLKFSN